MYTTCLFCAASLGTNEAIEAFPVGQRVAFDAWRGRLWAVCGRCGRWNLAPIEERWEPVEQADRLFTDTRRRVQSGNIGLAKLSDGTRLIRVGKALPGGELAAWRYGTQLVSRRKRNLAFAAGGLAGGVALIAGLPLIASAGVPIALINAGIQAATYTHMERQKRRVVLQLPASASPTGEELLIRRWHLHHAALASSADGDVALDISRSIIGRTRLPRGYAGDGEDIIRLSGDTARRLLSRSMMDYNQGGASQGQVEDALLLIDEAGGPDSFTQKLTGSGAAIVRQTLRRSPPGARYSVRQILGTFRGQVLPVVKYRSPFFHEGRPTLSATDALALEMALQEEAERRALEGELAALEAAWREAEEIAQIADSLIEPRPLQQQE